MQFAGHQSVSRAGCAVEDWTVVVAVEQCDWERGYICGTMTAGAPPRLAAAPSNDVE